MLRGAAREARGVCVTPPRHYAARAYAASDAFVAFVDMLLRYAHIIIFCCAAVDVDAAIMFHAPYAPRAAARTRVVDARCRFFTLPRRRFSRLASPMPLLSQRLREIRCRRCRRRCFFFSPSSPCRACLLDASLVATRYIFCCSPRLRAAFYAATPSPLSMIYAMMAVLITPPDYVYAYAPLRYVYARFAITPCHSPRQILFSAPCRCRLPLMLAAF